MMYVPLESLGDAPSRAAIAATAGADERAVCRVSTQTIGARVRTRACEDRSENRRG